jgi:HD superfamily phosphohydrolase
VYVRKGVRSHLFIRHSWIVLRYSFIMPSNFEIVRDPLWNNIRIDADALRVLDSEPLQRLRYIRQLGHAFLVYPGSTHTRFEHALGTYHLTRRTIGLLRDRGELGSVEPAEISLIRLAALLHDVGHYPFSHALEEAGLPSHEVLAEQQLCHEELTAIFDDIGIENAARRIRDLITGDSQSPLQGLVSGSLDLDKIEYLTRDARMCGVPYGTVDVDRLVQSLTLITLNTGRQTIGVHEKGVSALESLLFARYQMYRNVYWHHAVRSATAMFKRLVREVLSRGELDSAWISNSTDEALMEALERLPNASLATRLRKRRLYKRVFDIPAGELPAGAGSWIATDPDLAEMVEDWLAEECGVEPGSLLLDFPQKAALLAVDLPVQLRSGEIVPLNRGSGPWPLGIQQVGEQLHSNARHLRVFAAEPVNLKKEVVLGLVEMDVEEVGKELGSSG